MLNNFSISITAMERYIPQEARTSRLDTLPKSLETGAPETEKERARAAGDSAERAIEASPEMSEKLLQTA